MNEEIAKFKDDMIDHVNKTLKDQSDYNNRQWTMFNTRIEKTIPKLFASLIPRPNPIKDKLWHTFFIMLEASLVGIAVFLAIYLNN